MRYSFSDCVFDTEAFELRRNGALIETTPQVLSILKLFLVSRSRLIPKQELIDEIWDGRAISYAAITVRMRALRHAIGDSGARQQLIKTVRGKGYRFVGDVVTEGAASADTIAQDISVAENTEVANAALAKRIAPPSVAVLPFQLHNPERQYSLLPSALADDILTSLSRLRSLTVIARGSSFQYRSYSVDPAAVGAALNVRYCLAGSMEVSGNRMSLSLELSDTKSTVVIWRDRQEFDLSRIHELRDEIVGKVAAVVEDRITTREMQSARLILPDELGGWQAYHRGLELIRRPRRDRYTEAKTFFEQALEIDPSFARAQAGKALAHYERFDRDMSVDIEQERLIVLEQARRAVALDPLDPFCQYVLSCGVRIFGDPEGGIAALKGAIELNPNYAIALADLGYIQAGTGAVQDAKSNIARAMLLSPKDASPARMYTTQIIIGIIENDLESATSWADRGRTAEAKTLPLLVTSLTAYHLAGKDQSAREMADMVRRLIPDGSFKRLQRSQYQIDDTLARAIAETHRAYGLS